MIQNNLNWKLLDYNLFEFAGIFRSQKSKINLNQKKLRFKINLNQKKIRFKSYLK